MLEARYAVKESKRTVASMVLVGMRSEKYVDDVMYGLQTKKLDEVESKWKELEL